MVTKELDFSPSHSVMNNKPQVQLTAALYSGENCVHSRRPFA